MPIEIERKFLLKNSNWKELEYTHNVIKQGYLNSNKERTVRVRVTNNKGFITIKGEANNLTRPEFEYEIPVSEALQLLELCEDSIIEKTRYNVQLDNHTWEIDVFDGDNKGLVMAEIELNSENENINIPEWIGSEVSGNIKYYNSNLIKDPYKNWH